MPHWRRCVALFAAAGLTGACAGAPPARGPWQVTVSAAAPARIEAIGLRLEWLDLKDERCPVEVRCVWAGHATLRLRATLANAPAQTLELGTSAPPGSDLPGDARLGPWRLHLSALEPARRQAGVPPDEYVAHLSVSAAD
jgi:hypothetical protein